MCEQFKERAIEPEERTRELKINTNEKAEKEGELTSLDTNEELASVKEKIKEILKTQNEFIQLIEGKMQDELKEIKQRIIELERESEKGKERIGSLQEKVRNLETKLENKTTEYKEELSRKNEELKAVNAKLEDLRRAKDGEIETLSLELRNKKEELSKKDEELKAVNAKLEDLRKVKDGEIKTLNLELERKKVELSEKDEYLKNANVKINNLTGEIEILKSQLGDKEKELEKIKIKLQETENNLTEKEKELQSSQASYEEKKAKLTEIEIRLSNLDEKYEPFKIVTELYESYLTIPEKEGMKELLKYGDIRKFIASGVQESNIGEIWDYIKTEIQNQRIKDDSESLEILKKIFIYFFDEINRGYESPVYERVETELGEEIDSGKHLVKSGGNNKITGRIEKVVFPGYSLVKNGKIIKKSIVILED